MKAKTHSGAKKRVKVKGKGKTLTLTFDKAAHRHLMVNKSKKQKAIRTTEAHSTNVRALKRLLKK
ncbi:MAG: 50S ribosomal protein L35 [Candidatus Peregrinibacteria bacterium]|nr:50S ribosomal protein L35 [Candidatus Peregrinibacteria bacterium]MDZ4244409.1 50S ribosomal protein L35 [Candidatus Gracilibacteria bacterium]